jgi:arylsulfatase
LTKTDRLGGRGVLAVDGSTVGSVDIPRMMRGFMPFTGMSVGCDNVAPVATTYESPFRFTGELHRVEVRLIGDEARPDASAEHRTEMGKQ